MRTLLNYDGVMNDYKEKILANIGIELESIVGAQVDKYIESSMRRKYNSALGNVMIYYKFVLDERKKYIYGLIKQGECIDFYSHCRNRDVEKCKVGLMEKVISGYGNSNIYTEIGSDKNIPFCNGYYVFISDCEDDVSYAIRRLCKRRCNYKAYIHKGE